MNEIVGLQILHEIKWWLEVEKTLFRKDSWEVVGESRDEIAYFGNGNKRADMLADSSTSFAFCKCESNSEFL